MKYAVVISFIMLVSSNFQAMTQELPYREIPPYPADYSAGNIVARTIDGLGFRYYWATDSLRPEDLEYKPSEEARTAMETLQHIYGLADVIYNGAVGKPNVRPIDFTKYPFEELRKLTLLNLQKASEAMAGKSAEDIAKLNITFKSQSGSSESAYWHMLNGPLADALWHTGQIVSFRRASGNPFNSKASVFTGKVRQ